VPIPGDSRASRVGCDRLLHVARSQQESQEGRDPQHCGDSGDCRHIEEGCGASDGDGIEHEGAGTV